MPVSTVHEEVHERTGEKRQPNEKAGQMGAVLAQQKHTGDNDKAEQREPDRRSQETPLRFVVMTWVIMNRHALFSYSTMSRPRNMPIGHANANSPGSLGRISTG